jgi:hypothetical protein
LIAAIALTAALTLTPAQGVVVDVVQHGQKVSDGSSLYVGRHYHQRYEKLRKCIRLKESRNAYGANNGTGKYRGAYQLSINMRIGASWMIQKELRLTLPERSAKRIGAQLRNTHANNWHPFWQDMAFWIIWNDGAGRSHWAQTNTMRGCT